MDKEEATMIGFEIVAYAGEAPISFGGSFIQSTQW